MHSFTSGALQGHKSLDGLRVFSALAPCPQEQQESELFIDFVSAASFTFRLLFFFFIRMRNSECVCSSPAASASEHNHFPLKTLKTVNPFLYEKQQQQPAVVNNEMCDSMSQQFCSGDFLFITCGFFIFLQEIGTFCKMSTVD